MLTMTMLLDVLSGIGHFNKNFITFFFLYSQANFLTCSQYNNFSIIYLSIYFEEYSLKRDPQGRTYDIVDRKSCYENGNMCCQCKVSWNIQTIIFFHKPTVQHAWYIITLYCIIYFIILNAAFHLWPRKMVPIKDLQIQQSSSRDLEVSVFSQYEKAIPIFSALLFYLVKLSYLDLKGYQALLAKNCKN